MRFLQNINEPYLVTFPANIPAPNGALISTQAAGQLPFSIRRVFWIVGNEEPQQRGGHAHRQTQEILIALQGKAFIQTEADKITDFTLDNPATALYIPALCWLKLTCQPNTIVLALASTDFDELDYIREYSLFKQLRNA